MTTYPPSTVAATPTTATTTAPDHATLAPLHERGYCIVAPQQLAAQSGVPLADLLAWQPFWEDLPTDNYLRDGGRYRYRRHSCFIVNADDVHQVPHRPHWQPLEYNALHGGMQRHFEPMAQALTQQSAWLDLLRWLGQVSSALKGAQPWFVEAHQFRIDTTDGIGRPTPEGAHRDGVDVVGVFMVQRKGIKGGETRVFEADGPNGQRFTLQQPWSLLLLDDERVIHESTPIQPFENHGYRDTLVITLRANHFQSDVPLPPPPPLSQPEKDPLKL
jgi:hypothetical protein